MMVAKSNDKATPLLVGSGCAGPSSSLDGFPIRKNTNKIPENLDINKWSNWIVTPIPVLDFYINIREIQWRGKKMTVEIDLFKGLVKQFMEGDTSVSSQFRKPKTKEAVFEEIFEMGTTETIA